MKLSSEERLLIGCAFPVDAKSVSRAADLIRNGSVDWDHVMLLAHWHRMTGTLFASLRDNVHGDLAPQTHMEHLRSHYRRTAVRTLHIRAEFTRAVRGLQAENIEVMALKGVALLDRLYPDPGSREMSDIDLLVKPEAADRAQEIVRALGYEPVGTEWVQERTRQVHRHLPKLHDHSRELSFEIHVHFISSESPLHFDIGTVWQHAVSEKLNGVEVLVPAPEHMLLHLGLHFFLDRRFTSGSGLKQLGDVVALISAEGNQIDWDFFLEEVRLFGLEGPVFSVLSTATALVNADVPDHVLDSLRPADYSEKMQALFIRQRVLEAHTLTATELVPHQSVYTFRALLKGALHRIVPSRQYMETHYGDGAIDTPRRMRLKRLGELAQRTFWYVRNPMRLWQEVRVDWWLHSLSSSRPAPGDDKHRSGEHTSTGNVG